LLSPKYITNVNARIYLRFIEWEAIRRLHFDTDGKRMADAFPEYSAAAFRWPDNYNTYKDRNPKNPTALALNGLYVSLLQGKVPDLGEFYIRLRKEVTNRKRGKALTDSKNRKAKKATTKASYTEKDVAFVDYNRLVSVVKRAAVALAHTECTDPEVSEVMGRLVSKHHGGPLPEAEMVTLQEIFSKKAKAMELSISKGEADILRHSDKQLAKDAYHLYGLFKLRCEVGDTWALPQAELAKELGRGKEKALAASKLLEKLKLIETTEPGRPGTVDPRATIYKRLR
jgi:hypothetical protein